MSLSILTGHCWPTLAERFDTFVPTLERNVVLVGTRDVDKPESSLLTDSAVTLVRPTELDRLEHAIMALAGQVGKFYVHVDVDVLDESEGRANSYACTGGLSADELCAALNLIQGSGKIAATSITAYDPGCDSSGRIRPVVDRIATILAA